MIVKFILTLCKHKYTTGMLIESNLLSL